MQNDDLEMRFVVHGLATLQHQLFLSLVGFVFYNNSHIRVTKDEIPDIVVLLSLRKKYVQSEMNQEGVNILTEFLLGSHRIIQAGIHHVHVYYRYLFDTNRGHLLAKKAVIYYAIYCRLCTCLKVQGDHSLVCLHSGDGTVVVRDQYIIIDGDGVILDTTSTAYGNYRGHVLYWAVE
jgi:hypothetical protein